MKAIGYVRCLTCGDRWRGYAPRGWKPGDQLCAWRHTPDDGVRVKCDGSCVPGTETRLDSEDNIGRQVLPQNATCHTQANPFRAVNNLEPGTVYPTLDDALRAATCLCSRAETGATIYGTTDPDHADPDTGEAYRLAVASQCADGSTWTAPKAPYTRLYTILVEWDGGGDE